jgi:hypothetical protein
MQSIIQTTGYGYHKRICEDVATWFLNRFLPRHKLYVEILHRGLKREQAYGYCDYTGESYRPREFLIELDTHMNQELYIKTLLHELVHLQQWVIGTLRSKRGKRYYGSVNVEELDYEDQPHEIEAQEQEEILYQEYMSEKNPVPVSQVVQYIHQLPTECPIIRR